MSDPAANVAPLAPGVFTWPSPEAGSETLLRIPDYDLVRPIGAGAYGEVWLARSTATGVIFVRRRPKLADIGLVTDASDTCSIVGTEGYLPPEGPGTPQADLFALGKVLYEAATGLDRREFPKLPEDARSWSDAKLLFELNEAILKACAPAVGKRYGSAELLHADLELLGAGKSIRRAQRRQGYWQLDWIDLAG